MEDLFKAILGKTLDEATRLPSVEDSIRRLHEQAKSRFPIRVLGTSQDATALLTEEDRESHMHILGSPGEGKSKLLELLLRQDIDNGYGACLLDPSDNGETAYKVLKYAIKKGFEKVVLIDPHDIWESRKNEKGEREYAYAVPTINPIHYSAPPEAASGELMDATRVLWKQKDFSDTGIIQDYLPSIFTALHQANMTLAESKWFRKNFPVNKARRAVILDHLHALDDDRMTLEEVFAAPSLYRGEYRSTARRLKVFQNRTMELILGSNASPMDFLDLITKKYIILVNLDPEGVFGQEHQRLLGTLIINEITHAIQRLRTHGWKGRYYLYIDEAGDYATSKLAYILDKKRKSGLSLTLAHQRFDHFDDKAVASAVYGGTKIKVLFNTFSREDRDKMIRMMYGGDLTDREVSFTLSQLKQRHAVIKVNKQPPAIVRLQDVPDIEIPNKVLTDFKTKLYHSYPFYRSIKSIREEINSRFAQKPQGTAQAYRSKVSSSGGAERDSRDYNQSAGQHVRNQPASQSHSELPETGAPNDGGTDSPPVSLQQKRPRKKANLAEEKQAIFDQARKLSGYHKNAPEDAEV